MRSLLDIPLGEREAPLSPEPVEIAEATVLLFDDDGQSPSGRRAPRLVFLQFSSEGLFVCFSLDPFECFWSGRDLGRVSERWEGLTKQRIAVADLMRRSLGTPKTPGNGGDTQ